MKTLGVIAAIGPVRQGLRLQPVEALRDGNTARHEGVPSAFPSRRHRFWPGVGRPRSPRRLGMASEPRRKLRRGVYSLQLVGCDLVPSPQQRIAFTCTFGRPT
jgi:hypothetical protein